MCPTKYIRDPVHDVIEIDCDLTQRLIDTQAFQRLRRIKQLGLASFVYPGADHSRFSHSLGTYSLSKKLIGQIEKLNKEQYSPEEKRAIPIAALCHDIGHGPFSHLFEKALKEVVDNKTYAEHEYWSSLIVRNDPEIDKVFEKDKDLLTLVWKIISKAYKRPSVVDIVSSELDVDRFDYLMRDSHMTGVKYGDLDLSWILRCIQPAESTLADKRVESILAFDATRGSSVIEAYILGRHCMYKHVYWYHSIRSAELMLRNLLSGVLVDARKGKERNLPSAFQKFATSQEVSLDEYLELDDVVVWSLVTNLAKEKGPLGVIAKRLCERNIFRTILYSTDMAGDKFKKLTKSTEELAMKKGFDPDLHVIYDDPADVAIKSPEHLLKEGKIHKYQPLYYVDKYKPGRIFELAKTRGFVSEISYGEKRLYVPEEIFPEAMKIWTE